VEARSRAGTTIGGWLAIRYFPSTTSPSLDSACRLSRVCAFAATFSARFSALMATFSSFRAASSRLLAAFSRFFGALAAASFFSAFFAALSDIAVPATAWRIDFMSSSSSRWAYQMSIVGICAKEAIASR
jgi:hypothetical protein